jgi:hypothetical protein
MHIMIVIIGQQVLRTRGLLRTRISKIATTQDKF